MSEIKTEEKIEKKKVSWLDNHKFAREHKEMWLFIKSNIVGAMGAIPELFSYMLLCPFFTWLGVTYLPNFFLFDIIMRGIDDATKYAPAVLVYSFLISTLIGQGLGFVFQRKLTFHANSNVALSTFLTLLLILFTIVANGFVGPGIVALVGKLSFLPESLIQMIGKVLSMMATVAWIYPANRFVIHRVVKKENPEREAVGKDG